MLLHSHIAGASLNGFAMSPDTISYIVFTEISLYKFILCLKSVVSVCQLLTVSDSHADKNSTDESAFPSQLRTT